MLTLIKKIFGFKEKEIAVDVKKEVIMDNVDTKVSQDTPKDIKEPIKKVPKRTKKVLLKNEQTIISFVPKKRGRPKKSK